MQVHDEADPDLRLRTPAPSLPFEMYTHDPPLTGAIRSSQPSQAMLDEIHDHLVRVLTEKLHWTDATEPEMSAGGGHVVIRFKRNGQRYVFRVAKHGLPQHKRTMLAYRLAGPLGLMPEKIYHDGVSVVERHAEGSALSARVADAVLARLGQGLGRLHALPAQGFGPLDFDTQAAFPDAMTYYAAQSAVSLDWAESDLSDSQVDRLQAAVHDANEVPLSVRDAPVRLGHGDLWAHNVIVDATSFTIIDWDRIGAYPVERDLAFLLVLGLSAAQCDALLGAYALRDAISRERLSWFARRWLLRDRGLRLADKAPRLAAIDALAAQLKGLQP